MSKKIPTTKIPLYQQLSDDLCSRIRSGEFPLGSRIPCEPELIEYYHTSITTVRKAVQQLCDAGMLDKRRALGTFVVGSRRKQRQEKVEKENFRIGVIMPDLTLVTPEKDPRNWQLNARRLNGIYQKANELGCSIFVYDLSAPLNFSGLDGVIIVRHWELEEDSRFELLTSELDAKKIPWVVLSEYRLHLTCRWWVAEHLEIEFYSIYRYLYRTGSRKLLILGPGYFPENPRLSAIRNFSSIYFLEYEWLPNDLSDRESAYRTLAGYPLEKLLQFDTIFCTTDLQALGVMDYLLEKQISIPGQLRLMGCDNLREAASAPIPLSSVEFSGSNVGAKAVELLLKINREPENPGEVVFCRGKIIERESTRQQ